MTKIVNLELTENEVYFLLINIAKLKSENKFNRYATQIFDKLNEIMIGTYKDYWSEETFAREYECEWIGRENEL